MLIVGYLVIVWTWMFGGGLVSGGEWFGVWIVGLCDFVFCVLVWFFVGGGVEVCMWFVGLLRVFWV